MPMKKEMMESYKNKLEHERLLLVQEIKDFEKPVSFGSDVDHFDEKTDETEELSNRFGQDNDLKRGLDEINAALEKIEKGIYGICETCGGRIGDDILEINPESRLCKDCKIKS